MLRHFRPLFVKNALEPGDVAGLEVSLVEVNARSTDAAGAQSDQAPALHLEDACRIVSCHEESATAELRATATLDNQAEVICRFRITVLLGSAVEPRLLEHPRSLGVIASLARPAVLDACQMVMTQLLQKRSVHKAGHEVRWPRVRLGSRREQRRVK